MYTPSGPSRKAVVANALQKLVEARRLRQTPTRDTTVVSDSEEERQRRIKLKRAALATVDRNELRIIEISSDEEDRSNVSVTAQKGSQSLKTAEGENDENVDHSLLDEISDSEERKLTTPKSKLCDNHRVHKSALGSGSQGADGHRSDSRSMHDSRTPQTGRWSANFDDDVIDLTLSSPESQKADSPTVAKPANAPITENSPKRLPPVCSRVGPAEKLLPLFLDSSDSDEEEYARRKDQFSADDGAILVLNEPRSTHKPVRRKIPGVGVPNPSTPQNAITKTLLVELSDSGSESDEGIAAIVTPKSRSEAVASVRSISASPSLSKVGGKAPRMTKKALHQRELERRRAYAESFFKELNESIFDGGIPASTELKWSNRLLTTAGRAHWHRTRDGVHITSIQLAEKILDCDERIRNTLSHEMCHLACWIIDDAPDENHGALFKSWGKKIMRRRPEIEVTTRHNYEIKYKYEWKCATCAKVYGRHSKSIDPEEYMCGVCKVGQLEPQFESRQVPKTPKVKAHSQNAAARSHDSPLVMPGAFSPSSPTIGGGKKDAKIRTRFEESEDGDSDIEILTHTLKGVQLTSTRGDA